MSNADTLPGRALAGDRDAWDQLFRLWNPRMECMLRSLSASNADIQEIAQETWVRVIENRDRYDPARAFGPFLYTIAKHLWADRMRKLQVRRKGDQRQQDEQREPGVEDPEFEQWELAHQYVQRIDHCLGELKTQDRRILGLRYHDDWTNRQIAELLADTESQVKHRVYKVVHLLRDCVDADPELPTGDILNKILALLTTSGPAGTAASPVEVTPIAELFGGWEGIPNASRPSVP